MYIGNKVKELRNKQDLSLSELAEKSGVQIATLSRIEHLKMTGSLDSHLRIAKALGIDIAALYSDIIREEKKVEVQTAKAKSDVFIHNEKASYEMLTQKVLSKKMMPILLKIEPGGKTNLEQYPLETEKFIIILEGKIDVKIGEETYSLTRNNTLYFDASLEHSFINSGKSSAKILSISTPVTL